MTTVTTAEQPGPSAGPVRHGGGWAGKVLFVDLSDGSVETRSTFDFDVEKYLGGVGLCSRIYWEMGCPHPSAFDPAAPLFFSVGPLTGLPGPFNRAELCGIAPQSYPEELFTYSGVGGKFPAQLKYAGYDAVVVTGAAETPVYLEIDDEEVAIRDATDLWGTDSIEAQQRLVAGSKDRAVLAIGPAGENLSRVAVVAADSGGAAGQGGLGAVMGAKKLKAVVVEGTGVVELSDPQAYRDLVAGLQERETWSKGAGQGWARAPLWGSREQMDALLKKRKKCAGPYGCPFQCNGFYDVPGKGKGYAMCVQWWYSFFREDPDQAPAVWEAQILAQKLGVNHFELYGILVVLRQLHDRQLLTPDEWIAAGLPKLPVALGGEVSDEEFIRTVIEDVASGTHPLSQGMDRALRPIAEEHPQREAILEILELQYPAWGDIIHWYGWVGLALHVITDVRDAGNSTDGYLMFNREGNCDYPTEVLCEHFDVPGGPDFFAHPPGAELTARWDQVEHQTVWVQHEQSIKNSLPICNFASLPSCYFDPPDMDIRIFQSRALSAVTGMDVDPDELWRIGERIWQLRRAVMVKAEGRTREQDVYAERFYDKEFLEMHDRGFGEPALVPRKELEEAKLRYYELRGWDREQGWPTRERLESLGMADVADGLEAAGRIGR